MVIRREAHYKLVSARDITSADLVSYDLASGPDEFRDFHVQYRPASSSELASRRMRNTRFRGTPAELAIRRPLHARVAIHSEFV